LRTKWLVVEIQQRLGGDVRDPGVGGVHSHEGRRLASDILPGLLPPTTPHVEPGIGLTQFGIATPGLVNGPGDGSDGGVIEIHQFRIEKILLSKRRNVPVVERRGEAMRGIQHSRLSLSEPPQETGTGAGTEELQEPASVGGSRGPNGGGHDTGFHGPTPWGSGWGQRNLGGCEFRGRSHPPPVSPGREHLTCGVPVVES